MNAFELEAFELIIELYDHNPIFTNDLIGIYSIGLSTLHRSMNHEIYKNWVGVFHPDDPNKITGYLNISCFIVGPGERPPVHGPDEEEANDAGNDSEMDEEEVLKAMENINRAKGVTAVDLPDVIVKNYQLTCSISKAESLYQEYEQINPFISCRVNGCMLTSRKLTKNQNPQFLSKLAFPVVYPFLNHKITMKLWSQMGGMTPNRLIANIPEHPNEYDFFNIPNLQNNDGRMDP